MMKDQFEKKGEGKLYASHGLFVCSSQLVEAFEMCVPQCAYDFLFHSKNLLLQLPTSDAYLMCRVL